jgi:DNA-binding MarR family transcriptional regulator
MIVMIMVHNDLRKKPEALTTALDASPGYSLRRAQLSTYREYDSFLAKFDIRPSQFAVLVLIRSNPGLRQSAVATALGIQKANFVAVIDRLEARRPTERRSLHGDRRSSALYLTRSGETLCERLQAAHAKLEAKLASRLGIRGRKQFLEILHEFASLEP